mmetsp:Transcript_8661/g.22152  ORF Transcript_8661/g.22152 Transcript_8661/m.22152 type:complete len:221 (+) Transcript_8661:554-1216(+)
MPRCARRCLGPRTISAVYSLTLTTTSQARSPVCGCSRGTAATLRRATSHWSAPTMARPSGRYTASSPRWRAAPLLSTSRPRGGPRASWAPMSEAELPSRTATNGPSWPRPRPHWSPCRAGVWTLVASTPTRTTTGRGLSPELVWFRACRGMRLRSRSRSWAPTTAPPSGRSSATSPPRRATHWRSTFRPRVGLSSRRPLPTAASPSPTAMRGRVTGACSS